VIACEMAKGGSFFSTMAAPRVYYFVFLDDCSLSDRDFAPSGVSFFGPAWLADPWATFFDSSL
jgi:hypothetical protein